MAIVREIQELAGTELKLNINIEPMGDVSMDDYDFECMFFPYANGRANTKKSIVVPKADMLRIDGNNYIAFVDTTPLGAGEVMCKLTAYLPDDDMPVDKVRTEIVQLSTGIAVY